MKRMMFAVMIVCMALVGCSSRSSSFNQNNQANTSLAKSNYKLIKANATGKSSGFRLLGIIPFASPSEVDATNEIMGQVDGNGKAIALANVVKERSSLYLILFSIPKVTVRADIIEFTE